MNNNEKWCGQYVPINQLNFDYVCLAIVWIICLSSDH